MASSRSERSSQTRRGYAPDTAIAPVRPIRACLAAVTRRRAGIASAANLPSLHGSTTRQLAPVTGQ